MDPNQNNNPIQPNDVPPQEVPSQVPGPAAAPIAPAQPQQPMPNPQFAPQYPVASPPKSKLPLVIGLGLVVLIVLAAAGFLLTKNSGKKSNLTTNNPPAADTTATTAPEQSTPTQTAPAAAAGDVLQTLCYSVTLPSPHAKLDGSNACTQRVSYGKDNTGVLHFDLPSVHYATFEDTVAKFKGRHPGATDQKETTIGGLKAYELQEKGISTTYKYVIVFVKDKGYTYSNTKLTAIEIWAPYQDKEDITKAQFDAVLASVTWK